MAYCRKCGAEMPDDAKFCPKCGTGVEQKPSWGLLIVGLLLLTIGLTTLFGVVGTIIGLVIDFVAVVIMGVSK